MLIAAATFVIVVSIVVGSYWLAVGRAESESQRHIRKRLRDAKVVASARQSIQQEAAKLSGVPALNALLTHRVALFAPLQRMISQSGLKLTVGAVILGSAVLFLLVLLLVEWLTGLIAIAILSGLVGGAIPYWYVAATRKKRVAQFEEFFPEALDLITRAMRAGHAFTTGLAMVAEEMPSPIGPEFRLLYDQQNYGYPLPNAMRAFADRIPLVDAKFFVTAVLTQREAGGNLAEVLENLAAVMRDRFKVRRDIRTKTAHARMTGWVLAGLPPSLALVMVVINPEPMKLLVKDPIGINMIIGGLVLQVIGTLVIRRLVRIEY